MTPLNIQYTTYALLLLVADADFSDLTTLPCKVNAEPGLKYRRVTWYKVEGGDESLTGLVLKNLRTNETALFKSAEHAYQIGEDLSLYIPSSAISDCATYRCTLWPPVGHRIQEADYFFHPEGCREVQKSYAEGFQLRELPSLGQRDTLVMILAGVTAAGMMTILSAVVLYKSKCQTKEV